MYCKYVPSVPAISDNNHSDPTDMLLASSCPIIPISQLSSQEEQRNREIDAMGRKPGVWIVEKC